MEKYYTKLLSLLVILVTASSLQAQDRPFVTTWVTYNPGVSCDSCIVVPTFSGATYDYEVDVDYVMGEPFVADFSGVTGDFEWNAGRADTVTIAIRGEFPRIYFNDFDRNSQNEDSDKLLSVDQWGDIQWQSMDNAFSGCRNLNRPITDNPDLSSVTDMSGMFWRATAFNQDISGWDVSNVTNMNDMFASANAFNQDIGGWDVSSVRNMGSMFSGADVFNRDISGWDVSSVNNMEGMFSGADVFNQDISGWDVSSVIVMDGMFRDADVFNQDIGDWDVSGVTTMWSMFNGATSFNQDIGDWDVSGVRTMFFMFRDADVFNQDIGDWDVSGVRTMWSMFNGATSFNQDISSWDVNNVVSMRSMFDGASSFNQDLGSWDLSGLRGETASRMLDNSGLSCENYTNTLIGWSQSQVDSITLGAEGLTYSQVGAAARQILIDRGWTITGDIEVESCATETTELPLHKITLRPNPATDILYIEGAEAADVQVLDLQGRVLPVDQTDNEIDIRSLPAGLYLVKVVSKEGRTATVERFVKN